jgi:hypothetical protein
VATAIQADGDAVDNAEVVESTALKIDKSPMSRMLRRQTLPSSTPQSQYFV